MIQSSIFNAIEISTQPSVGVGFGKMDCFFSSLIIVKPKSCDAHMRFFLGQWLFGANCGI